MSANNDELKETLEKFHQLAKVKDHLKELNSDLDEQYGKLAYLRKQVDKEYDEYEKLEKGSMKGWFYQMLGSKEEQLEKERQEYLQVALQFDECKASIEMLEYEKKILEGKIDEYSVLKRKVSELKKIREKELMKSGSILGKALMRISKKSDALANRSQDVADAVEVGREALELLHQMIKRLKAARNWGNWDMYNSRGSHWSGYAKHSSIDEAKALSYKIKFVLRRLDEELIRIYGQGTGARFDLSLDRFSKFTDIFFDNLISDWIVQQKIINALNNVSSVKDQITRIVRMLEKDGLKIQDQLIDLKQEREKIILDPGS